MCGIAGIIDLAGRRDVPESAARAMARALHHRGPDEEGFHFRPGLALASRRLSIVGLADGQQPMFNEDRQIAVVYNGELFDHAEVRKRLEARGHQFKTNCDTEILPHLWEDHDKGTFAELRGQFAAAIWDERKGLLALGRDRFGICPLYWTRQGDWLLFASEIKALLASGMVKAAPDRCGIDNFFSLSAIPGPRTCFEGISLLSPGAFLTIPLGKNGDPSRPVREQFFWRMDFPDRGEEVDDESPDRLVDQFEQILLRAVEKRLRADVPVGSYLSGGVDSSMIAALACHLKGPAINTYTIQVKEPDLDELSAAQQVAQHIGTKPPIIQEFGDDDATNAYPALIRAAEAPVVDTSSAALLLLAARVNRNGQKVVLTGEGADEWLVGYPWYKAAMLMGKLDLVPGISLSNPARRAFLRLNRVPMFPWKTRREIEEAIGGPNAWIDAYGMMAISKLRFFNREMLELSEKRNAWAELDMDLERARKWHPLNRGVWIAARVTLAGHLLQGKGDRVAMNSSVEVRYPFLDEDVFDFTSKLHPHWKLHGWKDKRILRLLAERWVPPIVYNRQKKIFRAPLDSFHLEPEPRFVRELLSEESLRRTGYFDIGQVSHWRKAYRGLRKGSLPRLSVELGLTGVVATQLWHHLFIDNSLADLPAWNANGASLPSSTPRGSPARAAWIRDRPFPSLAWQAP